MNETKALIKSCVVSKKDGVLLDQLNHDFEKLVGESIPYRRLGYRNLWEFIQQIDGIHVEMNENNKLILTTTSPKIAHIDSLIQRQKNAYIRKKNNTRNRQWFVYNKRFDDATAKRNYRSNSRRDEFERRRISKNFQNRNDDHEYYSSEGEEEFLHPVLIHTNYNYVEDEIYIPKLNGHQFIGDDFFLQLAIRKLGQPIKRRYAEMALSCGLCVSGQTINDCSDALKYINKISKRVVIMLGSVDVYNGSSCDEMIDDMQHLLNLLKEKFDIPNTNITLCTIPPLANLSLHGHREKLTNLYSFNSWITSLSKDSNMHWMNTYVGNYPVIDLFGGYVDDGYITQYQYYQSDARMVSGTKHPYVLFSKKGRKHIMDILRQFLCC